MRAVLLLVGLLPAPLAAQRAAAPRDSVQGLLPPIPRVRGPLALRVVYPQPGSVLDIGDSTFVLGSTGTGDAALTVAGQPVAVAANGAWLAWIRVPDGPAPVLEVRATRGAEQATVQLPIRRARSFVPPAAGPWVDTATFVPRGRLWRPAGEPVPVAVRAAPGAQVTLRLGDGRRIPLLPAEGMETPSAARLAFDRDTTRRTARVTTDRYAGLLDADAVGADPGPVLPGAPAAGRDAPDAVLEVALGGDTVRAVWPLQLARLPAGPLVVRLDDDPAGTGAGDSVIVGRTRPGGTYHWFFRTGTRAQLNGRHDDTAELRLGRGHAAWVAAAEAELQPAGTPPPAAVIGALTLEPRADRLVLRLPWSAMVPVQVLERPSGLTLRIHAAVADADWIRYGGTDPLVTRIAWRQAADDLVEVDVDLARPLWGWLLHATPGAAVLEVRRPPVIDPRRPLAGRRIVLDPGHPPLGATGPTGLREAEANLAVARRLAPMLRAAGATVLLTRDADTAVALGARVPFAEAAGADLLVSIHNNALPDGVEPYANSGTSVFYNRLPGLALARAVQEALVRSLGVRGLGIAQGDLALVRGTWVPAVLTEGLFMPVPAHEAALRDPRGQRRYALAVRQGIEAFLRASGRPAGRP